MTDLAVTTRNEAGAFTPWLKVLRFAWRLHTFQLKGSEFAELNWRHLVVGAAGAMLAGMGRHYDDANALLAQRVGAASLVYVLVISSVLWLLTKLLRPARCTWVGMVTLVSLVSFSAWIYALPVELWFSAETAVKINLGFVVVVSTWRVSMLLFILRRYAGLSWLRALVAAFLPISAVVCVLAFLQAMNRALAGMGGMRPGENGMVPLDMTGRVLEGLGQVAMVALPVLALVYLVLLGMGDWQKRKA